jgi:hypothetical protein
MTRLIAILVAALGGCGGAATADVERGGVTAAPTVSCRDGGLGAGPVKGRDVKMGPLTILSARWTVRGPRDAFNGHGWKLPVTLRSGESATLTVPSRLRGRVGFVFTRATQSRVWRRGVRAADPKVRFVACAGEDAPARTGWPGGIVVDRRRCVTLGMQLAGAAELIERRVPLGKRCRPLAVLHDRAGASLGLGPQRSSRGVALPPGGGS